jgi:hypothetical protein
MLLAQILICISFCLEIIMYYTNYLVENKTLTTEIIIIILLIYFAI